MTHSNKQMNAGYTIDQTILIIAIIAILITIIIATVGWDLLQRAGGAKVASHFRQLEGAIGEFYSRHGMWPHEATTTSSAANHARILNRASLGNAATGYVAADHKMALPAYEEVSGGLEHGLGPNSASLLTIGVQTSNQTSASRTACAKRNSGESVYVGIYAGIPIDEIERANASIDGANETDPHQNGRIIWTAPASGLVTARFCANRF